MRTPRESRLDDLLKTGSSELESALAVSTDIDGRLLTALTRGSGRDGNASRLDHVLDAGEDELRQTLSESIDVQERLEASLSRLTSENGERGPLRRSPALPYEHHTA
uniref:hypothetical protein n=1 Tax=Streptomyces virginiae TaxID=1961 RepID=UPI002F91811A